VIDHLRRTNGRLSTCTGEFESSVWFSFSKTKYQPKLRPTENIITFDYSTLVQDGRKVRTENSKKQGQGID
jgi:hypothetical protein